MLVNAHDHLSFYKDLESAIDIIQKNNILTLSCSMNIEDYKKHIEYRSNFIKIGLGVHPWKVDVNTDLSFYEDLIKDCDFIGEIGLDFYWEKRSNLYQRQMEVFEYFIKKAKEYNKVCNIHTKGAEIEVLEILKKYNCKKAIIHWYSGDIKLVKEYLEIGCYFTVGVDVGYSKLTDELINLIPINRLLVETDGPTSLEWVNGVYGNPDYVKEIYKYISKLISINEEVLISEVNKNLKRLFTS